MLLFLYTQGIKKQNNKRVCISLNCAGANSLIFIILRLNHFIATSQVLIIKVKIINIENRILFQHFFVKYSDSGVSKSITCSLEYSILPYNSLLSNFILNKYLLLYSREKSPFFGQSGSHITKYW